MKKARASEEPMEKGGCIACHRIDEKLIGPPYKAVAAKYRSNKAEALAYLLTNVREGGHIPATYADNDFDGREVSLEPCDHVDG